MGPQSRSSAQTGPPGARRRPTAGVPMGPPRATYDGAPGLMHRSRKILATSMIPTQVRWHFFLGNFLTCHQVAVGKVSSRGCVKRVRRHVNNSKCCHFIESCLFVFCLFFLGWGGAVYVTKAFSCSSSVCADCVPVRERNVYFCGYQICHCSCPVRQTFSICHIFNALHSKKKF